MKRNITKLGVAVVILVAGVFVTLKPSEVYAVNTININDCGTTGSWEDGNGGTAVATSGSGGITLTLNNYNGDNIFSKCNLNLVLVGDNSLNLRTPNGTIAIGDYQTSSVVSLTISGDGSLSVNSDDYDAIKIHRGDFTINSGRVTINTNGKGINFWDSYDTAVGAYLNGGELNIASAREGIVFSQYHSGPASSNDVAKVHINGTKVDINVTPGGIGQGAITFGQNWLPGLIAVDGGELNVKVNGNDGDIAIEASVFNQTGGIVNVEIAGNEGVAAMVSYAVFNGGIATFSTSGEGAVAFGMENSEDENRLAKLVEIGAVLPKDGAIIEFNDGDVTMNSGVCAFAVKADSYDGVSIENATIVNNGLIIEPTNAKFSELTAVKMFAFSDGEGEPEIDMNTGSLNHVAKTLHIYKAAVPVPPTDEPEKEEEEEVPNTVDAKIVALAFGLLFAIIAEGAVIADLYRRLFGYKKEIAEVEKEEPIDK